MHIKSIFTNKPTTIGDRALLICYVLFMSFGNFFRFLKLPFFKDNILLSEVFLYSFAIIYYLAQKKTKTFYKILFLSLLPLLSWLYGSFLNGYSTKSFLFAGRLSAMFLSSYALGIVFWKNFGSDIQKFLRFLILPFVAWLIIGFFIYIFFPSLSNFWRFLESYHVVFHGDPHNRRFVSVLFDPNFYSSIAFFPILISFMLYNITKKMRYFLLSNAFLISAILSWSRSGIATVFILLGIASCHRLLSKKMYSLNRLMILNISIYLFLLIGITYLCNNDFEFFVNRLLNVFNDGSALCRWQSFQKGLEILQDHLFLGIGYNYLPPLLDGLNFLDSSLLGIVVCIGIFPFSILLASAVVAILFKIKKIRTIKYSNPQAYYFSIFFFYFIFVTVFFSSQFNNILFFSFWIIPTLSCFFYLSELTSHNCEEQPIQLGKETCKVSLNLNQTIH